MAEDKLLKRVSSEPSGRPRNLNEIFDPTAFEERLKLARVRRAVALAQREINGAQRSQAGAPGGAAVSASRWAESGPRIDPVVAPGLAMPVPRAAPPRSEAEMRPRRGPRVAAGPHLPSPIERIGATAARFRLAPIFAGFLLVGVGALAVLLGPGQAPSPSLTAEAPTASPLSVQSAAIAPASLAPASIPSAAISPTPVVHGPAAPAAASAPVSSPQPASIAAAEPVAPLSTRLAGRPYPRPKPAAPVEQAADSTVPVAPVPALAGIRVFVHFPPSVGASAREAEIAEIRGAGFPAVEPVHARAAIDITNVRYFHPEDADAARLLAATLGDGTVARDFTDLSPPPRKGRLEVWMRGSAPQPQPSDAILQILQGRTAQN